MHPVYCVYCAWITNIGVHMKYNTKANNKKRNTQSKVEFAMREKIMAKINEYFSHAHQLGTLIKLSSVAGENVRQIQF